MRAPRRDRRSRGGSGDARPAGRVSGRPHFYNRPDGSTTRRRVRLRGGRPDRPARVPRDDAARGLPRRRARVCRAAQGCRRRHRHPRLHPLPADRADRQARLRPRRHARLLGGGDCARGGGDAATQAVRERRGARGVVSLPHDRGSRRVPRTGSPLPPVSDRRRRARDARRARGRARLTRADGRRSDELRPIEVELDFLEQPHAAVLFSQGKTKVLCTATVQDGVPRWLYGKGRGWMTAEYSLLPASTGDRVEREAARGKQQGRTVEIQRLIGRALRGVVDFRALSERTMWLDCDVLQADGGTRCAAICGAYVAGRRALDRFGLSKAFVDSVGAVSVGVVDGVPMLDLDYSEDSNADSDMNVVMTGDGRLIEVQATAEKDPFTRETLDDLLALAERGVSEIGELQVEAVSVALP